MIKKDKWYKLTLSFQLRENLEFQSDESYLRLWKKIGKVLGIDGYVADVSIRKLSRRRLSNG